MHESRERATGLSPTCLHKDWAGGASKAPSAPRGNLTLLRVPGRVPWDLPCLPLPHLCVSCRYDVDSKSPDLSKHVSSACDCPANPGFLKCLSLTGPWTSLKAHVSRTAHCEGGGVAVNAVADTGLFCPGYAGFPGPGLLYPWRDRGVLWEPPGEAPHVSVGGVQPVRVGPLG